MDPTRSPEMTPQSPHYEVGLAPLARGWATILGGMLVFVAVSIFIQFTLARRLGPAELGLYYLGDSALMLLAILSMLGLEISVVRKLAAYHASGQDAQEAGVMRTSFTILSFSSLLVGFALWAGAELVAVRLFRQTDLAPVLRVAALGVPLLAFTSVIIAMAQGYQRMDLRALVERITVPLAQFIFLLAGFAWLGRTSLVAAWSLTAANLVGLLIAVVYYWRVLSRRNAELAPSSTVLGEARRGLLSLSMPFMLARITERLNLQLETWMLGFMSTSVQVGLYTASLKATVPIGLLIYSMNFILSPLVASGYARQDIDELARQFQASTRWAFTLALPLAGLAAIFSPEIMALLGPGFTGSAWVLRILALSQLFNVASGSVGVVLAMTRFQNLSLFNTVLMLLISLLVNLELIPRYGALGAAVGASLGLISVNALALVQVHRRLQVQPYNRKYWKPLTAGLAACLAGYISRTWFAGQGDIIRLALGALVLGAAYFGLLLAFGLEPEDRRLLRLLNSKKMEG